MTKFNSTYNHIWTRMFWQGGGKKRLKNQIDKVM